MGGPAIDIPGTVLIVDDDPVFAALMGQVLAAQGVRTVLHAADGMKAEAELAARPGGVDAMTLDLSMPNQDGVTFLRQARQAGFAGRLLLISGEHPSVLASAERLARILGLDCVGALPKPVDYHAAVRLLLQAKGGRAAGDGRNDPGVALPDNSDGLVLEAHYQPKVRLSDGRLSGAEALARASDAQGRPLDIETVVAAAERQGWIGDLTWRMIESVVADAAELGAAGRRLKISFNISAAILDDRRFPDKLAAMLRAHRLEPGGFVLELTESRIPDDVTYSLEAMTRLRMLGFMLAIDDFGTGASNIERLRLYPFTELKIDKGFVLRAAEDGFSRACVEASIRLARELRLLVVAEGVETERELELVRRNGADEGQGFLFGRPMPFPRFRSLVLTQESSAATSLRQAIA